MTVTARQSVRSTALLALWTLTGVVVLSVVLTSRRPGGWPAVTGLGFALAVGLVWLGWVLATSGPSQMTCWGSSDGPSQCTSNGVPIDPDAIAWATAAPWFVGALVIAVATGAIYVLSARTRSSADGAGR
ncbi:hypothetical protein V6K52_13500 [Knoellia sp. S7-12]|uniref:hypothetical protein n=1 Tax=Knoellia sp. S7-12 TaxID=3126698 RepID=UPI003367A112